MIFEHRTYRVQPGKAAEFLKLYQAEGLPIISRYGRLIGCLDYGKRGSEFRALHLGL